MEKELIRIIEENLRIQHEESKKVEPGQLDNKWELLTSSEPKRFINPDMTLKLDVLRNFRKLNVFITDSPPQTSFPLQLNPISYVHGGRRGVMRYLKELYCLMADNDYLDLLKKHPVSTIGHPNIFRHKGFTYTARWVRHIFFLGLFRKVLADKIKDDFFSLDIGSSYGIFSSLLKKENRLSCHILLDFPEQLALAHYFIGSTFPNARIASCKELAGLKSIDRGFLGKYDFILLPWFLYKKLGPNSVDMVTNFASFGEMRREWFDYYLKSEPFLSAKYFFSANRFQSYPEYDTDITILDYPLHDFKKLHFCISPYFSHTYKMKNIFWYEKYNFSSQYFEFIGERDN